MPRDDSAYLIDMLLAARDAMSFTEGMSFDDFARDRRTQLSVLKSVEIVGEAAAQVSEEVRRANPDIPWREIVGLRNRLVHVYFDIDLPVVWDTVRDDLPALIALLEPPHPHLRFRVPGPDSAHSLATFTNRERVKSAFPHGGIIAKTANRGDE